MKIRPKILMEVMSPYSLKLVLLIMYSVLIVSIYLSVNSDLAYNVKKFNGMNCEENSNRSRSDRSDYDIDNNNNNILPYSYDIINNNKHKSCTYVSGLSNNITLQNTTWFKYIELSQLELYFTLSLDIVRNIDTVYYDSNEDFLMEVDTEILVDAYAEYNVDEEERFFLKKIINFQCSKGKNNCDSLVILDENEYIYNFAYQHLKFNVTVNFYNMNPFEYINATSAIYSISYHDSQYRLVEIIFHAVFAFTTFIILVWWLAMLYKANALHFDYFSNIQRIFEKADIDKRKSSTDIEPSKIYRTFDDDSNNNLKYSTKNHENLNKHHVHFSESPRNATLKIENINIKRFPTNNRLIFDSSEVYFDINSTSSTEKNADDSIPDASLKHVNSILLSSETVEDDIISSVPPILMDELVLFEQRWIAIVLGALFLYQNPIYPLLILNQNSFFWLISGIFSIFALGILMLFWWILISALGLSQKPDSWFSFYGWKYAFFVLFEIFSLISVVVSSYPHLNSQINAKVPAQAASYGFRYDYGSLANYISGFLIVCWILNFLYLLYITDNSLKSQPYLLTRHRQMAFRMFLFMANLVIIYVLAVILVSVLNRHLYTDIHDEPFPFFLISSVYVYLTAYIYIPLPPPELEEIANSASKHNVILPMEPVIDSLRDCCGNNDKDDDSSDSSIERFSLHTAKMLCRFSWETYFSPPNVEQYGFKLIKVIVDEVTDTVCFIVLEGNSIVIAFRGSVTLKNVLADFQLIRSPLKSDFTVTGSPMVHTGFYDCYLSVRPKILATISQLVGKNPAYFKFDDGLNASLNGGANHKSGTLAFSALETMSHTVISCFPFTDPNDAINDIFREGEHISEASQLPDKLPDTVDNPVELIQSKEIQIYCTGHSLGAALATLCSFDLNTQFPQKDIIVENYNFGSPRVGDHSFASLYNEAVPYTYRIVNDRDVVTSVPKLLFLYKHVGNEIVVDRFGNYIENPSFVERTMRSSRNSHKDHELYAYIKGLENASKQFKAMSRQNRIISEAVFKYLSSNGSPAMNRI